MRPLLAAACAAMTAMVAVAAASSRAGDDAGAPRAVMTCERAIAPGRVRCEVEATSLTGEAITWGDVVLVRTPPFVSALRGRIGPHDATLRGAGAWRWAFAVVARAKGTGDVEARVRLVACRPRDGAIDAGSTCMPEEIPVVGRVVVGE